MSSYLRVPKLTNPNIIIRLTQSDEEIKAANWLVYRNYIDNLYWPEDEEAFQRNPYLNSPARHVFVAVDSGRVIGTMGVIKDSPMRLPSDTYSPDILRRYRENNERIGEITSFAVDQSVHHPMNLILFLFKFSLQYSFYYLNLDRLIANCVPKHADFYEKVLCSEKLTTPRAYSYVNNIESQLIALSLLQAHLQLSLRYPVRDGTGENFYRFLYLDEHPNVQLPDKRLMRRSRKINWVSIAQQQHAAIAV